MKHKEIFEHIYTVENFKIFEEENKRYGVAETERFHRTSRLETLTYEANTSPIKLLAKTIGTSSCGLTVRLR